MRIAYIYPALTTIGGADRVISEKSNYFVDKCGFEVYVITAHQNGLPLSFPLSPGVKHIDLGVNFNEQYGYSFLKRGFIYLKLLRIYKKKLTQLLNELKVDITLTTISRDVDFLASLKDGSLKFAEAHVPKKYVRNNHLLQNKGFHYALIGKIWARKLEKAIEKFSGLIVLTKTDADHWKNIKKDNIYVIPNTYPFYPEQKSNCEAKKIICVGRLEVEKGHDKLIEVWEIVHNKHKDWRISVYGEGTLHDSLINKINEKGLSETFQILDPVKNISEKYLESSFLVLSSSFEGFGMSMLEAMVCGIPVVSFDCPYGPSYIISDGQDGLLVEPNSVVELANKIIYLIENIEIRKQMGKNAAENIRRYAPEIIMNQWITLFEEHKKLKS